jgi:hypothetical protein
MMASLPPASVAERIAHLRQELPDTVRIIAVTKTVSIDLMRQAYAAGIRDFGESRVQEALTKQHQLQDLPDITWHLIGHLQRNKVKLALASFDWIHSVDSLPLALRLDQLASQIHDPPNICLQVKLANDPSKYGWTVDLLKADLKVLRNCDHLQLRGLMTILPLGLDAQQALMIFQQLQQLAQELQLPELSMGMSGDYRLAVLAGATMVRLGRILFGDRPPGG